MARVTVTYLAHSGFLCDLGDTLLLFDDARKGEDPLLIDKIAKARRVIVFISHVHGDHFNPDIYALEGAGNVQFVVSDDLPHRYSGHRMVKGQTLGLLGATVTAFGSTDEGVSFLVESEGFTIFHAGDLNFWHWRDESTPKQIQAAEAAFEQELSAIAGRSVDIAFFPLDPRLGALYDAGALAFLMRVKPKVLIPMHFWDRADAAIEFARRNQGNDVEIAPLTTPGQTQAFDKEG